MTLQGYLLIIGCLIAGMLGYVILARLDKKARERDLYDAQLEAAAVKIGAADALAGIKAEIEDPEDVAAEVLRRRYPLLRKDWNFLSLNYSDDLVIPHSLISTLSLLQQYRLLRVLRMIEPSIGHMYRKVRFVVCARDLATNKFIKDPMGEQKA